MNPSNENLAYEKEKDYLKEYLSLISNKNNTYKRVCLSPLRYAGGKSKAIGYILENIPSLKNKKIVSPFFGGGSVEICLLHLGFEVVGYDIFNMLVNFWNVLLFHKDEFIQELKKFSIDAEEFTYNRHVLLHYWEKIKPKDLQYKTKKIIPLKENDKILLDHHPVLQAVYYYYNMSMSYGPMFLGWPSKVEINADKFKRRIDKLEQLNLSGLHIECKDFEEIFSLHSNDFLFLDPPYYLEGDSKMFKGMYPNCNFAIHHQNFHHFKLRELLKNHKGGFLMTYNDCSTIREWYKEYLFTFPSWQYSFGQGETRIGKNRNSEESNIKKSHEIMIICWPSKSTRKKLKSTRNSLNSRP